MSKLALQQEKEFRVTKSNMLIQSARSKMTAAEMKIIIYAISNIEMGDKEFEPCELPIAEFSEMCGITADAQYENLRKVTSKLKSRVIEIFDNDDTILQINWLRYVKYQKGKGTITMQLEDMLSPQLLELKRNFTTYGLVNVLNLRSKYAMQLYELLKSYENLGYWIIDLEQLKKLLYAEQYKNFNDFNKRILVPSLTEINDKTDLKITYSQQKNGKKIVGLTFSINANINIIDQRRQSKEEKRLEYTSMDKYTAIADLFELGRKLVKKEKEYIDKWIDTYKYNFDMLHLAYERSIMYTQKVSFPYIDSIIGKWNENDIRTTEQASAEEYVTSEETAKAPKHAPSRKPSYDINELEKLIYK